MIEVDKKELLSVLVPASNALGRIMPIYENILIAFNEKITAVSSNGEFQIVSGGDIEGDEILVNGKKILNIVKNAASNKIKIDINDGHIIVKSGRGRNKINTQDPTEFPIIEPKGFIAEIGIEQLKLKHMIASVKNSMAESDVRYFLNGLNIKGGERFVLTATDGHRLAQISAEIASVPFECIIPRTSIAAIEKLLFSGLCTIKAYSSKLVIFTDTDSITINLVDGNFPDTKPMLEQEKPNKILVNGKSLKSAISRTMISSGNEFRVDLDLSDKGIAILTTSKGEESSDFVEIESSNEGIENTVLTISGQYINNALSDDVIEFNYGKSMESVNIISDANHIIMPMKR